MDFRAEFRQAFREAHYEAVARGSARDELHRLSSWARRVPSGVGRGLARQLRAMRVVSVATLRDVFRGTPVLAGLILRDLRTGLRAGLRRIRSARKAPRADESPQDRPAPVTLPWKRVRKQGAEQPPSGDEQTGGNLGERAELAVIAFLASAVAAALGGPALLYLDRLLAPYAGGIALSAAIAWCLAAAMAAPRNRPTSGRSHPTGAGEERPGIGAQAFPREAIRQWVEGEVAAGAAGLLDAKGRGARLDDLVFLLHRKGIAEAVDRRAGMTLLRKAGITYRKQMKFRVGGQRMNAPGVHIDDLVKDLDRRPRLAPEMVPDITPAPRPSREAQ